MEQEKENQKTNKLDTEKESVVSRESLQNNGDQYINSLTEAPKCHPDNTTGTMKILMG